MPQWTLNDALKLSRQAEKEFQKAMRSTGPNERQIVNEALRRVGGAISALDVASHKSGDRQRQLIEEALDHLEETEAALETKFDHASGIMDALMPALRTLGSAADILYEDVLPHLENKTSSGRAGRSRGVVSGYQKHSHRRVCQCNRRIPPRASRRRIRGGKHIKDLREIGGHELASGTKNHLILMYGIGLSFEGPEVRFAPEEVQTTWNTLLDEMARATEEGLTEDSENAWMCTLERDEGTDLKDALNLGRIMFRPEVFFPGSDNPVLSDVDLEEIGRAMNNVIDQGEQTLKALARYFDRELPDHNVSVWR